MKQTTLFGLLGAAVSTVAAAGTPALKARASTTSATPITITGNAFYQGDERFYIRGVAYQPGGGTGVTTDPIANATACKRDIAYFTELNINTIRVYAVDNTADHDECMNALADAGIYLVLDTDTPLYSLNRDDPKESYNSVYLQSVFATVSKFANYTNTLAFLSGNEVINEVNNTDCAPYVKAVTRDIKTYIGDQNLRAIPVGYSAADVASNQELMADYMNCGTTEMRSDFYAINDYSWCDPSTFEISGWDTLVANYTNYGIPLFMSEFGCITNTRTFEAVASLYSTNMTGAFSGGLVYEYSEEGNGYGIVSISGGSVTPNDEFTYLKSAYASATNPSDGGGASSTSASTTCPTESSEWDVTNDDLPAMPTAAEKYLTDGAGTGPGLTGAGSQEAGDAENESAGTASADAGSVTATGGASATGSSASSTSTKKSDAGRPAPLDLKAFSVTVAVVLGMMGGMALL